MGKMTERNYDKINNEGAQGYNPIRAQREKREFELRRAEAAAYAVTPQGRLDALYRRIEVECGSVAREFKGDAFVDALSGDLYAQIEAIKAEMEAIFLQTWTLDITVAKRSEWNARVRSGEFKSPAKVYEFMAKQGWEMDALKKAVAHYKATGEIAE